MNRANQISVQRYEHRGEPEKREASMAGPREKPTREECRKQIRRLSGLSYQPREVEGIEVLIDALESHAESLDHAKSVIEALLSDPSGKCPGGYEIQQKCWELRTVERRPGPDCGRCRGVGFYTEWRNGYSGAGRCDCWREVEV